MPVPDKFFEFFEEQDPDVCWIWQGKIFTNGYGRLNAEGKSFGAHRLSYEHYRGPIPDGLVPDHLCMTKLCVNPSHLDLVTRQENTRRWAEQAITHCPSGHPYDWENTGKNGKWRRCKTCHREREATRKYKPGQPRKGRPINTKTKLGWVIDWRGLTVYEVCAGAKISVAKMSRYTAGRDPISNAHLIALSSYLDVEPEDLIGFVHEPVR